VAIAVQRGAQTLVLHTTILANGPGGNGVGFLGIGPKTTVPHPSVLASVGLAPVRTAEVLGETVAGFGHIFSPSGISAYLSNFSSSSKSSPKAQETAANARFVSPVGVAGYASDAVAAGWAAVFGLLIVINVSIGFINLLPLIPFDGGHIAVAMYEGVMSKIHRQVYRVDFAKLMPIAVATLSILAFIFLSSIFLDIAHPAGALLRYGVHEVSQFVVVSVVAKSHASRVPAPASAVSVPFWPVMWSLPLPPFNVSPPSPP
jgi:membrane-associated protease RseP (regulator of RpoE activity)